MIIANSNSITSPVRSIYARVELYDGSTLLNTFNHNDLLKSITVDRLGNTDRFFGYGICQKLNFHILDKNREIAVQAGNRIETVLGADEDHLYTFPVFYVTESHRDETTNELSVTAYDGIYEASKHSISEIVLPDSFTLEGYVAACAAILNLPYKLDVADDAFQVLYTADKVNVEGTETLREILDNIAEVTQTVYYIGKDWQLTFKRLDRDGDPVLIIDKSQYFTLENKDNRRLVAVASATELGDNYIAKLAITGTTQYIRNNPFLELIDDIDVRLNKALDVVGGLTVNQFECEWRGNFLLEIADKIGFEAKDGSLFYSYMLYDTIEYDGSLKQKTYWDYTSSDAESFDNPTSGVNISSVLKRTYAKVDKINKTIELYASDISENAEKIASLQLTTDNITTGVSNVEKTLNDGIQKNSEKISTLEQTTESMSSNISSIESTLSDEIQTNSTKISSLEQTTESLTTTISNVEEKLSEDIQTNYTKIGELEVTTEGIGARVTDTEESTSSLESGLSSTNERIGALEINTNDIFASVSSLQTSTNTSLENMSNDIAAIASSVESKMTSEEVQIQINKSLENGVNKVTTSTGFTFNDNGLTVSKTNSEMSTTITEDGMTVYKSSEAMLVANNEGVKAEDLHATTYLIIGNNSRFEDYDSDRTGCFWIGGNN